MQIGDFLRGRTDKYSIDCCGSSSSVGKNNITYTLPTIRIQPNPSKPFEIEYLIVPNEIVKVACHINDSLTAARTSLNNVVDYYCSIIL